MISSCQQTKITSLKINMAYPIEHAERAQTKYGEAILITLRAETPQTFLKVFLPRRYGALFTDEHIRGINEKKIPLSLKYLGTYTDSNSYMLELE